MAQGTNMVYAKIVDIGEIITYIFYCGFKGTLRGFFSHPKKLCNLLAFIIITKKVQVQTVVPHESQTDGVSHQYALDARGGRTPSR